MQDNFNIHSWKLKQAINELNEKKLCKECGTGYMEEGQCMECGYMEEGATFTDKFDDNPKLKGGQKDLPDEVQAKIVKEGGDIFADIEDDLFHGVDSKQDAIEYLQEIINFCQKKIADLEDAELNENEDHEVSMAQNSLKSIISSASQLMSKLGDDERNIPGWIQDHITNAENYIDQANQGFHELEPAVKDVDMDAMDMVAEGVSDDMKTKAKNALAVHLRSAMADKNQEHIDEIKNARDRINNAKSIDELANILGEFGYEDNEISDILGK